MTETGPLQYYPQSALESLVSRGVSIPVVEQVAISKDVLLENISSRAVLHPFTRLEGSETAIGEGAIIGHSGPATLQNSTVGPNSVIGAQGPITLRSTHCGPGTVLGSGVAEDAVFLGREGVEPAFTTGYGFRVRKGSLYEEGANSAQHTDTKMTLLLPFVTLGSNINWCDVLVAGGTGPNMGEFSEVGSGVIHFNFTPRGDKATASDFGNVTQGVFLNQPRVFLGGNGSMIGPLSAQFGAITTAGGRYSGMLPAGLNLGDPPPDLSRATGFDLAHYGSIKRIFDQQMRFIGELAALESWYTQVRMDVLAQGDRAKRVLYEKGREMVRLNLTERIAQLGRLASAMEISAKGIESTSPGDLRIAQQRALLDAWPEIEEHIKVVTDNSIEAYPLPDFVRKGLETAATQSTAYTQVIQTLPPEAVSSGVTWLQGIRDAVANQKILALVPEISR